MTKRWSSTRSLDGNTKQSASKEARAEQKKILLEEMFKAVMPEVEFVDCTNYKETDNG